MFDVYFCEDRMCIDADGKTMMLDANRFRKLLRKAMQNEKFRTVIADEVLE